MSKSSRRGVGGLISLIAILIVFGIASVALLSVLNAQTSLFGTQIDISEIQHDRKIESLTLEIRSCGPQNKTHFNTLEIRINNTSSQTSSIDAMLFLNDTDVTSVASTHYVFENKTSNDSKMWHNDTARDNLDTPSIKPVESRTFTIEDDTQFGILDPSSSEPLRNASKIILVTKLGNKIIAASNFTKGCDFP